MKTLNFALFLLLFLAFAGCAYATTDTIGATAAVQNYAGSHLFGFPIIASANGTLQSIGINIFATTGANIAVAIYSDSSNSPNAKLGGSAATPSVVGWDDIALAGVTIVSGTKYWIAIEPNGTAQVSMYGIGNGGTGWFLAGQTVGVFPDSFGGSLDGELFYMRMTYGATTTSTTTSTSTTSTSTTSTTSVTTTSSTSTTLITTTTSTSTSTSTTSTSTTTIGYAILSCSEAGTSIANTITYNTLLAAPPVSCAVSGGVVSGRLYFNDVLQASGTSPTANLLWNNKKNAVVFNTLANGVYYANSLTFSLNAIPYSFLSESWNATGYETRAEGFLTNVNITKYATKAQMNLTMNNILVNNALQSIAATNQIFINKYTVPPLTSNNLVMQANTLLSITLTNGTVLNFAPFNTVSQTEIWNYYPSLAVDTQNIIIGQSQKMYMNLTNLFGLTSAVVNQSKVSIGTFSNSYSSLLPYKYFYMPSSFVPSYYGIANPTTNSPIAITVNSLVQLMINGNMTWRNISNPSAFYVYKENLTKCTTLYSTKAFDLTFWNASSMTQFTHNVQINGHYQIVNGNYRSAVINGTDAGIPLTTNGYEYWTCMMPSWASFGVNATFNYSTNKEITQNSLTVNSMPATYYLISQLTNNVVQSKHLNLVYLTNPSQYAILVQNTQTGAYENDVVAAALYNLNTGNSTVINEVAITSSQSGAVFNLQTDSLYYFMVYSNSGTLLKIEGPFRANCAAGNTCQHVITYSPSQQGSLLNQLGNLRFNCTTASTGGNSASVTCSIMSVNGSTITGSLQVFRQNPIFNNVTCLRNSTGITLPFTCTVSNINSTTYHYVLSAVIGNLGMKPIKEGDIGTQASKFGDSGWMLVAMLVIVSSFGFIKVPIVGILFASISVIIAGMIYGPTASFATIGAIIVMTGMAIFVLGRKQ